MLSGCRYISEDYGGVALHPVDLLDAQRGQQLAALTDPNLTTISPVNKPHPRLDVIVSGSSRSLFAWRPAPGGCQVPNHELPGCKRTDIQGFHELLYVAMAQTANMDCKQA